MKRWIRSLFNSAGFDIRRLAATDSTPVRSGTGSVAKAARRRSSMRGVLEQLQSSGLNPATVVDVGVAQGTAALYRVFPDAKHLLIEPLEEFVPALEDLKRRLGDAEYVIAAAAAEEGEIELNVHADLHGSSIFKEVDDPCVDGVPRRVRSSPLDVLCRELGGRGPYLIKVDTQGAELEVLKGGSQVLKDTAAVVLEVSFFPLYGDAPEAHDCIRFMAERGFVVYDIFDLLFRPLDGALWQADIAFVPRGSVLRVDCRFATEEQRQERDTHLQTINDTGLSVLDPELSNG
jgi:FkbM family methyltransferase